MKEQIETVLIAGNETSALTLSYTILMLAMHPEIQDRLYEELHSVYASQDEYTGYEKIQQLPYLDMVNFRFSICIRAFFCNVHIILYLKRY